VIPAGLRIESLPLLFGVAFLIVAPVAWLAFAIHKHDRKL